MADKSQQLILEALERVVAEPGGLPLFGSKAMPGLFTGNAAGKQAAQVCRQEGYLQSLRTESRGKTTLEICGLSEKGLAYLLDQANPRPVMEAFVQSLDRRREQLDDLLASAHTSQQSLEELRAWSEKVLHCLQQRGTTLYSPGKNGSQSCSEDCQEALLAQLQNWHEAGRLGDCPLPQLYRLLQGQKPGQTIGQFHDGLRRLHQDQKIYLHPWTGPLYEIPEPALALLVGHEVAYYASLVSSQ